MERYTKEQRVKLVGLYFQYIGSVIAVQTNYRNIFGNERSA